MTSGTSEISSASAFADCPPVAEAVDTIVRELVEARSLITGVRRPAPELAASYEAHLARQTQIKGRPPVYPYVGCGLGHGPLVQLADGSVKWDMISGIGVHAFGHSDPDLVATALRAALSDTVMQGNLQFNTEAIEFAELLLAEAARTSRLEHCFVINSGALANESALKLCFQHNAPADRVLAFAHGFAGRTTTLAQITDSSAGRVGIPLTVPVDYVPFYDPEHGDDSIKETLNGLQQVIKSYPGRHACFVMELVQGEGGFNVAPREFFVGLMELCRDNGIAVWVDEIQTFGRTCEMFYFEQLGVGDYVDVVTVGKLSQACACLYTAQYNPKPGLLSATFVGSTVALHVGRRILARLREGGYYGPDGRIARLQTAFRKHMQALIEQHPDWFGPVPQADGRSTQRVYDGVGGMMRLTPFGGDRSKITKALRVMFDEGVIAFYCGHEPYHIRFLPPVGVMQPQQFDDVFEIMEAALARAAPSE